jgi:succinyl-CoA synthetase alpha subunit
VAIIIDETKRVIVQGITGREGQARTQLMKEYGTQVVAGCTPGKGGQVVLDVPVFDAVEQCINECGVIDISVIFVPAPLVCDAAIEAIEAGVKLLVIVPDRVPLYDAMEIQAAAKLNDAKFVGPNTLGVLSPGRAVLGMMGGRAASAKKWFKQGNLGITSRSGGITSSIGYYCSQANIGISTMVHVGGDSIVGLPHPDVVQLFEKDDDTKAVVMFGEIGGSQEERVADMMESGQFTKPLIAYIGGKAAKEGTRFSHAGAIVEGGRGTHEGKVERLTAAGAHVVDHFMDIPAKVKEVMEK